MACPSMGLLVGKLQKFSVPYTSLENVPCFALLDSRFWSSTPLDQAVTPRRQLRGSAIRFRRVIARLRNVADTIH